MKNKLFNILIAGSCAFALASCDDNSWNDEHLNGFDGDPEITDVQSIEYTLTAADYSSIANNSTNKSLAGDDLAAALKAVGTQHYFTPEIAAKDYIPAFLGSSNFQYFVLDNGSSVKVTYNVATNLPEEITAASAATQYEVSEADYVEVWGSDEDYISAFAPSHPAAKNIPEILKNNLPDVQAGQYAIVSYKNAEQEPVFTTVEEEVAYTHNKVASIVSGKKYVMVAEGNAATALQGKNYGNLGATSVEEDGKGLNIEDASLIEFTFVATDGGYNIIDVDGRYLYQSGTYNSFNFSAEKPESGAVWTVEAQSDGSMKITNTSVGKFIQYDTQYNSYGSYADARGITPVVYQKVGGVATYSRALAATVPSVKENAVYCFDGANWSVPADFSVLNPSDYTAMGQSYGNLSTSAKPEDYLPLYLKNKFPYAQAEDTEFVLYKYYDGSATYYRCEQYAFDGSAWILNNGVVEESAQFVKNNGTWMYDPNVTITLPNGGSYDICKLYYQTCVDWVFENIDKPLGSSDIKSGKGYVTSYGNNEYYCGTSAYYGNVDIRPDKALTQYPAGYEGKSNDEIVQLMKDRFCYEVMPAALAILHPDAVPVDGLDVVYTINFAVYTGSTTMHTVRYQVVAPATFEFIDCTWYEESAE